MALKVRQNFYSLLVCSKPYKLTKLTDSLTYQLIIFHREILAKKTKFCKKKSITKSITF